MSKPRVIGLVAFLGVSILIAGYAVLAVAGKRRAESIACGNYMCSICFAARLWADDNGGVFPADFLSMSNELATPKILICPGDHERTPARNWAQLTEANCSFELVTRGLREGDTNGVFLRCKVHPDHLGYADGTVFDGTRRRTKVFRY